MSRAVKQVAAGLALLTILRVVVSAGVPLAPDEAYYWVWSRALAPGYLDHPPMVALWIRAGTALAGQDMLGVRLLGPLSAAFGSMMLYDAAERLFPGRQAGLTAVVLINATLLFNAGSVLMTPDTPLLFFWTATLWAAARLATNGPPTWWLAAGGFTGLALLSKYTAAFLPVGLGLFALVAAPRSLRRPEPWAGLAIAALIFLPVVIWNAGNGWVSFFKQGGRVLNWRPDRMLDFIAELMGGQIGLATPGIFVLFAAGIGMTVRVSFRSRDKSGCLLTALFLPSALVFLQHAFTDRVQGNWLAVLYPAAAVAAAGLSAPIWRRWLWPSAGLGFGLAVLLYAHAISAWPVWTAARDPVARTLFGWDGLAARTETARQEAGAAFVAVEPYGLAGELALALPRGITVIGAGSHWITSALPRVHAGHAQGILVRPEAYGEPDSAAWRDWTQRPGIARSNGNVALERYSVFIVRAVEGSYQGVVLPRP